MSVYTGNGEIRHAADALAEGLADRYFANDEPGTVSEETWLYTRDMALQLINNLVVRFLSGRTGPSYTGGA